MNFWGNSLSMHRLSRHFVVMNKSEASLLLHLPFYISSTVYSRAFFSSLMLTPASTFVYDHIRSEEIACLKDHVHDSRGCFHIRANVKCHSLTFTTDFSSTTLDHRATYGQIASLSTLSTYLFQGHTNFLKCHF